MYQSSPLLQSKTLAGTRIVVVFKHMDYIHYGLGMGSSGFFGPLVILMLVWSLLWKGLALWRAAKRDDMWWFLAFLVINTFGILEIIYLFAITGAKLSDFTKKFTRSGHNH